MGNKSLVLFVLLVTIAIVLAACAPVAVSAPVAQVADKQITATPEPAQPSPEPIVVSPTAEPTQEPPQSYEGYWLKFDLQETEQGSMTLHIMHQDGRGNLTEIAWFCAHGAAWNDPEGVYFIFEDRATFYPSAPGGYSSTWFPNNLAWNFFVNIGNEYLHPAPWNTYGWKKCPTHESHGCVNMRPEDFRVLHDGGPYTNPFTNETVNLPAIGVGTPMVVVKNADRCTTLENCMAVFKVTSGYSAFIKYTCSLCTDTKQKWADLVSADPALSILDNEVP